VSVFDNSTCPENGIAASAHGGSSSEHANSVCEHTDGVKTRPVALIPEDLESLIPGYMKNRRSDISRIRQLVQNSEFEEVQRLAHSMKGSGGGYGFQKISELGASMEIAANSLDSRRILSGIDELEKYLDTVRIEYVDDDD
jgi:HPt (histidine-containing phosphotransfer) domain-containing protein